MAVLVFIDEKCLRRPADFLEAAMKMMSVIFVLFLAISASPVPAQEITRSLNLTESSYAAVRKSILVRPSEDQWEKIPWRPNLAVAIAEGREMDKPILQWMMNGHPCGMT